jgi:AcrR family transcriptional regulator
MTDSSALASSESPAAPAAPRTRPAEADARTRLLDGLAEALSDKAYNEITVADIVARAHVSKRTFYEQFSSKEACLLTLGERLGDSILALVAATYRHDAQWVDQLRNVTQAYLGSLASQPSVMRALYVDLPTLGPQGLALRRRVTDRFAEFLILQVERFRLEEPGKRPLTPAMAAAVVGGVNELILRAIEEDRTDELAGLTPTVTEFIQAVVEALSPAAAG